MANHPPLAEVDFANPSAFTLNEMKKIRFPLMRNCGRNIDGGYSPDALAYLRAQDARRLILVGDSDQLPSVGPGNVLRDLIESEIVPQGAPDRDFPSGTAKPDCH